MNGEGAALLDGEEIGTDFLPLELDELNQHPCMLSMICVLKHMERNHIIPSLTSAENGAVQQSGTITTMTLIVNTQQSSVANEMPLWMLPLHKRFSDPTTALNIKLFLLRLIIQTHTIFKPYARY